MSASYLKENRICADVTLNSASFHYVNELTPACEPPRGAGRHAGTRASKTRLFLSSELPWPRHRPSPQHTRKLVRPQVLRVYDRFSTVAARHLGRTLTSLAEPGSRDLIIIIVTYSAGTLQACLHFSLGLT